MRLLKRESNGEFRLAQFFGSKIPRYAILSHTWGEDGENSEVTFKDLMEGTGKDKPGYRKIRFCAKQAAASDLHYFWVDTCCIDSSSSVDVSEAINSMFQWYSNASKCYAYLSDVSVKGSIANDLSIQDVWEAFRKCRWFTRGWTLQELIAPPSVEFFSVEGKCLGDKKSLEQQIYEITGIPVPAFQRGPLSEYSMEERMSWAINRETKREEDLAYSLQGIFNVHMPLIYGEGLEKALVRLDKEIKASLDTAPALPLLLASKRKTGFGRQEVEGASNIVSSEQNVLSTIDHRNDPLTTLQNKIYEVERKNESNSGASDHSSRHRHHIPFIRNQSVRRKKTPDEPKPNKPASTSSLRQRLYNNQVSTPYPEYRGTSGERLQLLPQPQPLADHSYTRPSPISIRSSYVHASLRHQQGDYSGQTPLQHIPWRQQISILSPSSDSPYGTDPKPLLLFRAADKNRAGQLSEQDLKTVLVNGDWTSFDPRTVRMIIGMFDTDRSGTLDFKEFYAMWKFLTSWRSLFDRFDADQSQNISLDEYKNALAACGYRLSPQFVELLFQVFDKHGEGSLSFDLFVQSCIRLKRITDVFKIYDDDRDGFITLSFEDFTTEILRQH